MTYIQIRDYVLVFISVTSTIIASRYLSDPVSFGTENIIFLLPYFMAALVGVISSYAVVEGFFWIRRDYKNWKKRIKKTPLNKKDAIIIFIGLVLMIAGLALFFSIKDNMISIISGILFLLGLIIFGAGAKLLS